MRWKFSHCILLAYCIAANLANERPKRDLLKLKQIIASKLLKVKDIPSTQPNYRLYRIPGYDNILVKAIPVKSIKVYQIPVATADDNNVNETLKAIDDVNTLISLGILNSKDDKLIQDIIFPLLQPQPNKFTTTDVTQTYSVKPSEILLHVPDQVIAGSPPLEVIEDISIVPDDIKYLYKQKEKDEEKITFVSKNRPNTVINTSKKVPGLPHYIKMRLQEVASMGFNPYAFATPGAVIPARLPVVVEENVKVPNLPQSFNMEKEPGAVEISGLPVVVDRIETYTHPMDFHRRRPRPPILLKETVGVHPVLPLTNPPRAFVEQTSFMRVPSPGVFDVYHQPGADLSRPPVLVKETVKIPAVPPAPSLPPLLIESKDMIKDTDAKKIPSPPRVVDSNKVKRFSADPLNRYQANSVFNYTTTKLIENKAYDNKVKGLDIFSLSPFTEDKNLTYNMTNDTVVTSTNKEDLQIKKEKDIEINADISESFYNQEEYNTNVTSDENKPSLKNASVENLNYLFVNKREDSDSMPLRGDIPQVLTLSSEENEETDEELKINNNSYTNLSKITINKTKSRENEGKIVDDLDMAISPPPSLNDMFTNKTGSVRGNVKYIQREISKNLATVKTKPELNTTTIPTPPSHVDVFDITPQEVISSANDARAFEDLIATTHNENNSSNNMLVPNMKTTQHDKNKSEKYSLTSPGDSTMKEKIDSSLNLAQKKIYKPLRNRSRNSSRTGKNNVAKKIYDNNNIQDKTNTKSELIVEKIGERIQNISENRLVATDFIKTREINNQFENKVNGTSNAENIRVNANEGDSLSKKVGLRSKVNSTLFDRRNKHGAITLNDDKITNMIPKIRIPLVPSQNANLTSKLDNKRIAGDILGRRAKPLMIPTIKRGKNQTQDDKYALNPSRKMAINRLIGRNETALHSLKNAVTNSAKSRLAQKQTTKSSANNRTIVIMNRKIGQRSRRDVNTINKIPNHYLYVPPLGVDVPPPVKPFDVEKAKNDAEKLGGDLNIIKNNNIKGNPIIVMNSNSNVFRGKDVDKI